ncbi:uncharacterized protein BDV14DRAFT_166793 [Aspergillus stella-maris]|uniref:uncharacterized protein n=1 Tax=Aspergillus stella-maris TaxID=1810926 RepID=UPI003CCE0BF5
MKIRGPNHGFRFLCFCLDLSALSLTHCLMMGSWAGLRRFYCGSVAKGLLCTDGVRGGSADVGGGFGCLVLGWLALRFVRCQEADEEVGDVVR